MKDKDLKLDEIEDSHTLGGAGEGSVQESGEGLHAERVFITAE